MIEQGDIMLCKLKFILIIAALLNFTFQIFVSGQNQNGGPVVSLLEYSYQAVVNIVIKNQTVKICGGTIISAYYVLTTSTCFSKAPYEYYDIQVRVGSVQITAGGDLYEVSRVVHHPEYDSYIATHNLALISINKGIRFMSPENAQIGNVQYIKYVNSITLGHQFIMGGDRVTISGWSVMENPSGSTKFYLRDIYTYSMSYFPCLDYFRNSSLTVELVDDEILCIRNNPDAGYCDILEGSPVVLDKKLVGIYLYSGGKCSDGKAPLLFTRIANNLLWLHKNINADKFKGPVTAACGSV